MLQYIPIYYTVYVRAIKIQKYLQFVSEPSSGSFDSLAAYARGDPLVEAPTVMAASSILKTKRERSCIKSTCQNRLRLHDGSHAQPHLLVLFACAWRWRDPLRARQRRGVGGARTLNGESASPEVSTPWLVFYLYARGGLLD